MSKNSPKPSSPDPFGDNIHSTNNNDPSNNSSITSSRGGSRPGSAGAERRKDQRVRFGAGEALDQRNIRTSFSLRGSTPNEDSPSSTGPQYPQPLQTPPIMLTGADSTEPDSYFANFSASSPSPSSGEISDMGAQLTNYPPISSLQMPARTFSFHSVKEEDSDMEDLNQKIENSQRMRSHSVPNSGQTSPTLNAFSVGAGQAQGALPVDIPLLNMTGDTATVTSLPKEGMSGSEQQVERPKVIAVKEAHDLVRQHTRREGLLSGRLLNRTQTMRTDQPAEPAGAQTPNVHKQHADYVQLPDQFRGGVLGSLLKLYNNPLPGHSSSPSGMTSPNSSGRTTPKWYSKSANASTSSLGGLLAASGSALIAPAAGASGRKERPKIKHRTNSGGAFSTLKHMARPNLEEEIRV